MNFLKNLKTKLLEKIGIKQNKIIGVTKDTELYELVDTKMNQIDFAELKDRMENLEKVVYYLVDVVHGLTDLNKKNQEFLVAQSGVIEELIFTFEKLTKAFGGTSSDYTENIFVEKPKKPGLN